MYKTGTTYIPFSFLLLLVLLFVNMSARKERATEKGSSPSFRINRQALVTRHVVSIKKLDFENPLSVGNGHFAFTVDATGLQTFADSFSRIPLTTMAEWGWHSFPNPNNWSLEKYIAKHPEFKGYADIAPSRQDPEVDWVRNNPHRFNLGNIGLRLLKSDGTDAKPGAITDVEQTLDLWRGEIISRFKLEGEPVEVHTIVHPQKDVIAVRMVSPLLKKRRLSVQVKFPYASRFRSGSDWQQTTAHTTEVERSEPGTATLKRILDTSHYKVSVRWSAATKIITGTDHTFIIEPGAGDESMDVAVSFGDENKDNKLPEFSETLRKVHHHWNHFWSTGGAIDLSESKDLRWFELERRIVLSQYLTAIQCVGKLPPQESGLTANSWAGKFHVEMHWWHGVHFALWGRLPLFENSLGYYATTLPVAKALAKRQGYKGVRWPKMTGPGSSEAPSFVGPYLVWQQPHPIYFAEVCYRQHPSKATLEKYKDVIFQTADFMASFARWDESTKRYILGPPMQTFQERYPEDSTFNPTFELTYWRWGLEAAQKWRERLRLKRDQKWDKVLSFLSRPTIQNNKYLFTESSTDAYTNPKWREDNPSVLCALGMLPGPGIKATVMRTTLDWIWTNWNWPITWGPDFHLIAMTAARVGDPEKAIEALLKTEDKNRFLLNGHNSQSADLGAYLPGNGGLLAAVAMMAAGWDGAPKRAAPGFLAQGWIVKWENLKQMI